MAQVVGPKSLPDHQVKSPNLYPWFRMPIFRGINTHHTYLMVTHKVSRLPQHVQISPFKVSSLPKLVRIFLDLVDLLGVRVVFVLLLLLAPLGGLLALGTPTWALRLLLLLRGLLLTGALGLGPPGGGLGGLPGGLGGLPGGSHGGHVLGQRGTTSLLYTRDKWVGRRDKE